MLSTDEGGFMSRLADDFEAAQLAMGAETLTEASEVLDNPMSTHAEVRYALLRLTECLAGALLIAESRGLRLSVPEGDEDNEADEVDDSPAQPAEVSA
ncbi:hypothetical protein [Streptomyces sp. GQFP]|uniref:hypothetical protein n=1 Tax=Streptomyces sp. GQFP TaxID=2907545 RepID=UPI001F45DE5D|nr:hypothetical protein [Streptomyces sp. GQFP]UIX33504.1 hypothetical protein LUX31_27805 [Streptomyces sp. GQFP]